jgi:hypothetical protein
LTRFERLCDGYSTAGGDREMSDEERQAPNETAEKDPADWVTGDEPMTGPQRSYLHTLAQEAGQEIPDGLSKAEASNLIDELQQTTGRGEAT